MENGTTLQPEQILERAKRAYISLSALARDAGIDPSTLSRWSTSGRDVHHGKLRAAQAALQQRERALLRHLLTLYPEQEGSSHEQH